MNEKHCQTCLNNVFHSWLSRSETTEQIFDLRGYVLYVGKLRSLRRGNNMQVKARIDKKYESLEIQICHNELTPQVKQLVEDVSAFVNEGITGTDFRGEKVILPVRDISRFYAEKQKVMAQDEKGVYSIQEKLYELEERLDKGQFFRISKAEIVNLKKIKRLDMSITGTIKVILSDGTETYTSRRNVTKLKQCLGIKG